MAKLNLEKLRKHIQKFEFKALFDGYELGWDKASVKKPISINGATLTAIAEKRGFLVFVCEATVLPNALERKKIAQHIDSIHHEHLIIYFNAEKQIWQIAVKELNKPIQYKEVEHYSHQEPDLLLSKLQGILFTIAEEEAGITLIDVTDRIDNSFNTNTEKTTKKFYDHFKKQHAAFMALIQGLENLEHQRWYASLMMNRLMFIYFIQKKGFLDDDVNYLRTKLNQIQQAQGEDKFYSFYRNFLLTFFHNGLGKEHKNDKELIALIGNVPYLNGGLFDVHELEKDNADIQITDSAFTQLFDFFDQYQWHLDNGINAKGNEINPDVIGYIFEKYINDRAAMGAYYTKEDITEYISKNTIIPFLFDKAKTDCANAFKSDGGLWRLLKQTPDRYIYDAVKKGCDVLDIPENIEIGIDAMLPNLLERRKDWNSPTPENFGLPTEIWRETIARRQRYFELKAKLENGGITELNDFITYNLNIRQFAQDALEFYEGSDFIEAFYNAIEKITILDPTCGSGAFLFAALNILEPLYETCIKRMREFIDPEKPNSFKNFQDIISDIDRHQNPTYWIYKKIILNNLYGVDIMPEAVEIAKLRLFLKLAAMAKADHKKPNLGLEPLPDIDFNIRCGNTLVGFASFAEFEKQASSQIFYQGEKGRIVEKLNHVKQSFEQFKNTQLNSLDCRAEKKAYKNDLLLLQTEMNRYLAIQYGKDALNATVLNDFRESHKPFHWFAEFYEIIHEKNGFDVIIGNPPYVEYSKVKGDYLIKNYETESCGNLYAFVIERSIFLLTNNGKLGLIVPLSGVSTPRMESILKIYASNKFQVHFSFYAGDSNPSMLFDGVKSQLAIHIANKNGGSRIFTTNYVRWFEQYRKCLFSNLIFAEVAISNGILPKLSLVLEKNILEKNQNQKLSVLSGFSKNSKDVLYYRNASGSYYRLFLTEQPKLFINGSLAVSKTLKNIYSGARETLHCLFSSSLFHWYWTVISDNYHITKKEFENFYFNEKLLDKKTIVKLKLLSGNLMADYDKKSKFRIETDSRTGSKREVQIFEPRQSKPIIDEIDKVLAAHYGFTEQELDFIINYDIKYRMGKELD